MIVEGHKLLLLVYLFLINFVDKEFTEGLFRWWRWNVLSVSFYVELLKVLVDGVMI